MIEVEDPAASLGEPVQSPRVYDVAMDMLEAKSELTEEDRKAMRGLMHRPGYTVATRERAFAILERRDRDGLIETIDFRLPRLDALQWRRRVCELVGDRGWTELTPALVRALAYPLIGWEPNLRERPEYMALDRLHGGERVVDTIFDTFMHSNTVALQGLRRACWKLMIDLGARERLADLLLGTEAPKDDLMLRDLQAAARDLGVIPVNHEEIIWLRELQQPEWEDFWLEAQSAVASLPPGRRAEFELRDLAILITASIHEPQLLRRTKSDLHTEVETRLKGQRHHYKSGVRSERSSSWSERLYDHRDALTWGDLAAMVMALRALQVPEVVDHLFDYAERDRLDQSTEYGGIIRLDSKNRYEIIEFPPRVRYGDTRFEASQDMFDAGYGALFHFHYHAQRYRNHQYAGPGAGDRAYANNTRANCLVFTFVGEDRLNIDFYRHGYVTIDLGEVRRQ